MNDKKNKRRSWVTVLVVVGLLIVFLVLVDIEVVIDELKNANWGYLAIATAFLILGYLIQAVRWRYLLRKRPQLTYTFHTMNLATMTNLLTFIPTTPIRIYLMGENKQVTTPQATSSITIAIMLDWVMKILVLIGLIILLADPGTAGNNLLLFVGIIVLIFAGILLIAKNVEKIAAWLTPILARLPFLKEEQAEGITSGLAEGMSEVGSTRQLLIALGYSLLAWFFFVVFFVIGLLAFNINRPLEESVIAVMAALFFVNPTGPYLPGVFNVLLVAPMALVSDIDIDALFAFSLVIYAILLVIWFALGAWGMRSYKLSFKELKEQVSEGIEQLRSAGETDEPVPSES